MTQLPNEPRLRDWWNDLQTAFARPVEVGPVPAAIPRLEVRAFGAGQVWRDGQLLSMADWGRSENARELFFFLLERAPCNKEAIGAQFWPDLSPARMTSSFHAAKYRARRALGVDFVVYEDEQYHIDPKLPLWYDVAEFRRFTEDAAGAHLDETQIDRLRRAVALYAGDYLNGIDAEWAVVIRSDLQARFSMALSRLIGVVLSQSQYEEAVELCRHGLEVDYYREDWHRTLMLALAEAGHAAEALTHYQTAARRFLRELNSPLSADTQVLARYIRTGRLSGESAT